MNNKETIKASDMLNYCFSVYLFLYFSVLLAVFDIKKSIPVIDPQLSLFIADSIQKALPSGQPIEHYIKAMHNLRDNFNCIRSITYRYISPEAICIYIHAHKPYLYIGNNYCITQDNRILNAADYNINPRELYMVLCPNSIITGTQLTKNIFLAIMHIPECLHDRFFIECQEGHTFLLHDKENPRQTLLTDSAIGIAQDAIKIANITNALYKEFYAKQHMQKIIDCRFCNQVVVYNDTKEYRNGKTIG